MFEIRSCLCQTLEIQNKCYLIKDKIKTCILEHQWGRKLGEKCEIIKLSVISHHCFYVHPLMLLSEIFSLLW